LLVTPPLTEEQISQMSDDLFESVEENYVPGNQWQLGGNIFEIEVKLSHLHEQMAERVTGRNQGKLYWIPAWQKFTATLL
jgi:hypothetical protein